MPKHSKFKKAKRPWYAPQDQKSEASKVMAFALKYQWELRPQHLGIWVIARGDLRVFCTFSEEGDKLTDAVLVRMDKEDRKIPNLKVLLHFLARAGEYGGRI